MNIILCTKEESRNYLAHYGVKGMRKGVRRWQNEDGTYTSEGERHYGIGEGRTGSKKKITFSKWNGPSNTSSTTRTQKSKVTFSKLDRPAPDHSQAEANNRPVGRKKNITGKAKDTSIGEKATNTGPAGPNNEHGGDAVIFQNVKNRMTSIFNGDYSTSEYNPEPSIPVKKIQEMVTQMIHEIPNMDPKAAETLAIFALTLTDEEANYLIGRWEKNPNSYWSTHVKHSGK